MYSNRYKEKDVKGCESKHIAEEVLEKAFLEVFNTLVDNKQYFLEKWKAESDDVDGLKRYRLKEFIRILMQAKKQMQFIKELCLKMLGQIEVLRDALVIKLLDGTRLEYEL